MPGEAAFHQRHVARHQVERLWKHQHHKAAEHEVLHGQHHIADAHAPCESLFVFAYREDHEAHRDRHRRHEGHVGDRLMREHEVMRHRHEDHRRERARSLTERT